MSLYPVLHPEYPAVSLRPFLQFLLDYDFWMWAAGVNLEPLLPCASSLRIFPGLLLCSGSWIFYPLMVSTSCNWSSFMLLNFTTSLGLLMFFGATSFELQFSCQSFYWRMPSWGWSCNLWCRGLPKPRSVSWAPDECSTCSSWLDRLRRSCFSVYMSSICSLLRAIVGWRRNPDC